MKGLQGQIDEMQNKSNDEEMDKNLTFCIRNLPQTHRENLDDKVFDFVRKDRNDSQPGVIIVTCENMEGKPMIMRAKKELKKAENMRKCTSIMTSL